MLEGIKIKKGDYEIEISTSEIIDSNQNIKQRISHNETLTSEPDLNHKRKN